MMKYKGTYFNMWDAWYLNVNDTIHAFHLKSHPGENRNVGHVYTEDLLHFTEYEDNPVFDLDKELFVVHEKGEKPIAVIC